MPFYIARAPEIADDHARTRSAGAELHNVASLTGGMVAQEAIKLITKQYVPADNVCVYDGIHSKIDVIKI